MSEIEKLVPPLELCKQIAEGAFADSALVWWGACVYPRLYPDGVRFNTLWHKKGIVPAPTLEEIMEALSAFEPVTVTEWRSGQKSVTTQRNGEELEEVSTVNAATAALKLWLEVNNVR